MKIIKHHEMVSSYCTTHKRAVVYYEVKPRTDEELTKILGFYKGKIPDEIYESLKREDDNYLEFQSDIMAREYADEVFSFRTNMESIDPLYYIYCEVYDKEGYMVWTNNF